MNFLNILNFLNFLNLLNFLKNFLNILNNLNFPYILNFLNFLNFSNFLNFVNFQNLNLQISNYKVFILAEIWKHFVIKILPSFHRILRKYAELLNYVSPAIMSKKKFNNKFPLVTHPGILLYYFKNLQKQRLLLKILPRCFIRKFSPKLR